jgi:hypothetical protein
MMEQYEMEDRDIIEVVDKGRYEREASQTFVIDNGSVDASEGDRSVEPAESVGKSIVYNISGNSRCVFKVAIADSAPGMSRYLANTSGSSRWAGNEQLCAVRPDLKDRDDWERLATQHDEQAVTTAKRCKDVGKDAEDPKTHDDILNKTDRSEISESGTFWDEHKLQRAEGVWDGNIVINTA